MASKSLKPTHSLFFIIGYALGEFSFTFFLFFVAYYLMIYLTDVLQLSTAVAATVYTLVQWFEAITMLSAGIQIDRSQPKGGKFRPWLIRGSVIMFLGMVIFFTAFPLQAAWKTVIFTLFYLVAYVGYNLMWVAYRTLLGPLSRNAQDAVSLTSTAAQMGSLAGLIFSFIAVRLLNGFSTPQMGYTVSAMTYGGIAVAAMLFVSRLVKPFDNGENQAQTKASQAVSYRQMRQVFSKPMAAFLGAVTFREASSTIIPTLMAFFLSYVLHDGTLMTRYLTIVTVMGLIGHFFVRYFTGIVGKKQLFLMASSLDCICIALVKPFGTTPEGFLILMAVHSFLTICSGGMLPAFMSEIADYNEYTHGVSARAFTSSMGGTALRFAQIVGGGIASYGLAAVGYRNGAFVTVKMAESITNLMVFGSIAVTLAGIVFMLFYKIDRNTMNLIYTRKKMDADMDPLMDA